MNNKRVFSLLRNLLGMGRRLGFLIRAIWRQIKRWHHLADQRRILANLSDEALGELGVASFARMSSKIASHPFGEILA